MGGRAWEGGGMGGTEGGSGWRLEEEAPDLNVVCGKL
jgi:hypothetical protein